jgi:hypothetical protein
VESTGYPLHSPVSPSLSLSVRYRVPSRFNRALPTFQRLLMLLSSEYKNTFIRTGRPNKHRGLMVGSGGAFGLCPVTETIFLNLNVGWFSR